jgi:two-component system nitrate/nitrite response regulator NarL
MPQKIRVSILDDHQSIIDGYSFRLSTQPEIQVVATANYGDELESMLARNPTDVLLLDVTVPTSPHRLDPYPILHVIPRLLQIYDDLSILVISMHAQRALISAVMEAGASGYIFKDDQPSIRQLGVIVLSVTKGGIYLSHKAHMLMMKRQSDGLGPLLTTRQTEALSVCAAYPEDTSANLAKRMGIANSTMRNLLSGSYIRLNVRNRATAITKARQLGLITPEVAVPNIRTLAEKKI